MLLNERGFPSNHVPVLVVRQSSCKLQVVIASDLGSQDAGVAFEVMTSVTFEVRIPGHVTARGSHNPTIECAAPSILWSIASTG